MGKTKVVALGTLVGVALALAPLSSAFADTRFDRHWSHGGNWGGGHGHLSYAVRGGGHGCYGCFWPLGLAAVAVGTVAAAVVNTAAAVVTLPFVALNAAANAPYYAQPAAYGPPVARYDDAPPAYYNNAAPAYYAPPAGYYNSAPAPVYYGPPAAPAYYRAAPAYYAPPARYYAQPAQNYAQPPQYYAPPAAPAYNYGPPPDYYNQAPPAPGYYDNRR
jgi:hypothetical protein